MEFKVGDVVKILNDAPLSGNTVAPPVVIGEEHEVKGFIIDERGDQHIDLGLKSQYEYVSNWKTGVPLPDGDKIHWVHPSRLKLITSKIN